MKRISTAAILCLLLASAAWAKEREGVQMPDTIQVDGKPLSLVGIGLRVKIFFKVYLAGLYLETPKKDAAAVIAADEVKRVQMVMLRDLEKKQIADAIREGFTKNAGSQLPALKERLDNLIAQVPSLKKGETLLITYVPGKGTVMAGTAGEKAVVPGKDFADALFSVWLGNSPVDEDLKKGMLGG